MSLDHLPAIEQCANCGEDTTAVADKNGRILCGDECASAHAENQASAESGIPAGYREP